MVKPTILSRSFIWEHAIGLLEKVGSFHAPKIRKVRNTYTYGLL